MLYFLQGLTLGFAYVALIGVQNMFIINAGLTQTRRRRAYLTALIIIFFDVTLALGSFLRYRGPCGPICISAYGRSFGWQRRHHDHGRQARHIQWSETRLVVYAVFINFLFFFCFDP
jgi:hypothetical protein